MYSEYKTEINRLIANFGKAHFLWKICKYKYMIEHLLSVSKSSTKGKGERMKWTDTMVRIVWKQKYTFKTTKTPRKDQWQVFQ